MSESKNNLATSVLDIFLSRLKEQSFTIVLMLGGLYYQNKIYDTQRIKTEAELAKKDLIINELINDQIERMTIRESYLIQQRDHYVEDIITNKQ
jgi:hypothetical protein